MGASLRIAYLPSSYLPESVGGTEIYVHNLATALTSQGHELAVVYHSKSSVESISEFPYAIIRLDSCPPRRRADLYRRSRGENPPGFEQFLAEWKPDVVHFHALTLGAGLDHARLARKKSIPYWVTYHTPTFSCPRGTLMHWGQEICDGLLQPTRCAACVLHGQGWPKPFASLLARSPVPWQLLPEGPAIPRLALPALLRDGNEGWREFMLGAEHIIACAQWCKDVLLHNGVPSDHVTVIRQALPGPSRTRRLRLPLKYNRPLRLGFFGRFCHVKGPDLLLQAAERLQRDGLPVQCELTGPLANGKEKTWAERLLTKHASIAKYLGILRDEKLREWIRSLDLVVIPSRWLETGPLTLLEAWDDGVPVIGSNLGGIREFMETANLRSFLFEPNDVESLADAVRRAIDWNLPEEPEVRIEGAADLAEKMVSLYQSASWHTVPS